MKSSELPALKLFILLLAGSFLLSNFNFDTLTTIAIMFIGLAIGLLLLKYSYKSSAYIIMTISICFITSQRFDNHKVEFPEKIIPKQNAVFKGNVIQLLKSNTKYIRYIAEGTLDCAELPAICDTKILLTVFSPKFALLPGEKFAANVSLNFPESNLPFSQFDFNDYLKSNEIRWSATVNSKNIAKIFDDESQINWAYLIRNELKKRIFSTFDSTSAGIMTALLTGDKSLVNEDTRRNFSLSGTAHLLAVSGLHVGIISFLIFTLLAFVSNQKLKTVITILCLTLFVYMTGWLDSAVRATIMISVYLITTNFEKKVNPLNSLSTAALLMFLINPDVVYSISFRMSLLSVAGIILFYDKFRNVISSSKDLGKIRKFVIDSLSITFASSILISPLVAYYFGIYSVVSPFANLLVVPIVMLALSLGIIALLFSFISIQLATFYSVSTGFLINIADKFNEFAINYDFSYIEGSESIYLATAVSILILYIILSSSNKVRYFRILVSIILLGFITYNLSFINTNQEINISPRENLTAIIINNDMNCYLMMFDRMPQNSTKADFGIKNFILNNKMNIIAAYSGNSGIATIDAVKNEKDMVYFEINNDIQQKIVNLLNLKTHPVKMINL